MATYPNLYTRLVANTHEPENAQACWRWKCRCDQWGYGLLNLWVPMLGKIATVKAHIALFIVVEAAPKNANEFWLAFLELRHSGLEIDHLCVKSSCANPDHLELVTPSENCKRRDARRRLRKWH